jgi:hypothetical protein
MAEAEFKYIKREGLCGLKLVLKHFLKSFISEERTIYSFV